MAFFPLSVPLTTGPGTIAAAVTLAANWQSDLQGLALSAAAPLLIAAMICHAYGHASTMVRLFGLEGTRVITRLSPFLLLCVGVEIMLTGAIDALRPLLGAYG